MQSPGEFLGVSLMREKFPDTNLAGWAVALLVVCVAPLFLLAAAVSFATAGPAIDPSLAAEMTGRHRG